MRLARNAVFCLVMLVASLASALTPVREIAVRQIGSLTVDKSFVLAHVDSKTGVPADPARINRDVKAILDTDCFSDVRAEVESIDDDGIRLVFLVKRKLILAAPVAVVGASEMRDSKIRSLFGIRESDRIDEQQLNVGAQKIIAEYRSRYYSDISVRWDIKYLKGTRGLAEVTLLIDEGKKARIRSVEFSGNNKVPSSKFRKIIKKPSVFNPFRIFIKKHYDEVLQDEIRVGVVSVYRNLGYLDAVVNVLTPVVNRRGHFVLPVSIDEGEQYFFGTYSITGMEVFKPAELDVYLERMLKPGNPAGMDVISAAESLIADYYGSRGYISTSVTTLKVPAADNVINIHFQVKEGSLTRVGNIHFKGLTRTKDIVLRRELLVSPGDIYDEVRIRKSERILQGLGFFSSVRASRQPSSEPDHMDLSIAVEEKRTGQFMMGAGFSSVDSLMGFVELTQGNFDLFNWPPIGDGQKLNVRASVGERRQDYHLTFIEPWFLDRKLSFGADLYRTDVHYSDYDIERAGFAVTLSRPLPGPNRVSLKYQMEDTSIADVADTNVYRFVDNPSEIYLFGREEDSLESTLTLSLTHDSRDSQQLPTRGMRCTVFGRISGGPLGMDSDIYGAGFKSFNYVSPWFGHVISLKTQYEVVDSYGRTDEVPIDERLFAGGGKSLRGFDYRDVGPKVYKETSSGLISHRPVGGSTRALASVEYTVPIVQGVRIAGFYDIGNAWADPFETDFSNLASGAGVGVRLDMPGFPIRIDRGWIIERDSDLTDSDSWAIWIGYDY